jgi:hypothetical protein
VVCVAALFVIAVAYENRQTWAMCLRGIIAVLFNPIIKIPLSREIWLPIDFICAILFLIAVVIIKPPIGPDTTKKLREKQYE